MNPVFILDFSTDLSVFMLLHRTFLRPRLTCQHVDPSKLVRTNPDSSWISVHFFFTDIFVQDRHVITSIRPSLMLFYFLCILIMILLFSFFHQLTGEHKQMAKAMAKANKAASKAPVFKKRSASSSAAPPSKRRSFHQDKPVVCFNCQQPGHISPRCPNRPVSSTPSSKTNKVMNN